MSAIDKPLGNRGKIRSDSEQVIDKAKSDENIIRKDFTMTEAVSIWQAIESHQGQLRSDSEQSKPIEQTKKA